MSAFLWDYRAAGWWTCPAELKLTRLQALKEKREEEKLPIEQKIKVALKKWCREWEADLDARPDEVKNGAGGNQATVMFSQTMGFLTPLFKQLDRDQLVPELKAGLWMVVQVLLLVSSVLALLGSQELVARQLFCRA